MMMLVLFLILSPIPFAVALVAVADWTLAQASKKNHPSNKENAR
jgi:hypothetical protein